MQTKTLYEKRIECLKLLMENQQKTARADDEYFTVLLHEGKHPNGEQRLAFYQAEYRTLYTQCEPILR